MAFISLVLGIFIVSYGPVQAKAEPWLPTSLPTASPMLAPKIEFYVQEVNSVIQDQFREVFFGVSWEEQSDPSDLEERRADSEFQLMVMSENTKIMEIVNASSYICIRPNVNRENFTFTVRGVFLGYTKANVKLKYAPFGCQSLGMKLEEIPDVEETINFEIAVNVIRYPSALVDVVTGIMAALVAFNYVNMGVQLDLHSIGKVLRKPIGPTIGFVCQFFFMPLASYGISYVLLDDVSLRLGLFTLGCSPGGSMSNFWTLLFNGDVNLSVTMTFISTVAALAMMPLWIFTLGRTLFRNREATIPYINLAGSLIILTIPIGFGLLVQQYSPRLTKLSEKIIKPVTLTCVVFGVFVGLYANSFVFQLFSWQVVLAGLGIAWGGYSFGALMAWIFRLDRSQIIAVSIETAFQNPAVAFVMLLMSLPQPEADLTSVPVIAQLILTGMPMWALLVITRIYNKCKKIQKADKDAEEQEEKDYTPVATGPPIVTSINNNNYDYLLPDGSYPKPQIVRISPNS